MERPRGMKSSLLLTFIIQTLGVERRENDSGHIKLYSRASIDVYGQAQSAIARTSGNTKAFRLARPSLF